MLRHWGAISYSYKYLYLLYSPDYYKICKITLATKRLYGSEAGVKVLKTSGRCWILISFNDCETINDISTVKS